MKRHFLHLATMLLAGAALALTSCSDSDTDDGKKFPEPNFPEKVSKTVAAGETCQIEINPNQDWEVSVPKDGESAQWFWIVDGEHTVYSKSGNAGNATITIGVSELEEFDTQRSVDLTLTMGNVSKVIATIVRGTVDRALAVYVCDLDGEDFVYNSETGDDLPTYQYGQEPATTVELLWPEGRTGFMYPIKIEANFDWYISDKPEWVSNLKVNSGEAGKWVEIRLEGDKTRYPLDGDAGKLIFHDRSNDAVTYEFGVTIPACRDIFQVKGFAAESQFNYKAEYFNAANGDWVSGSAMGSITGIKGAKVYVFAEMKPQWGDAYLTTENTDWIVLDLESWDSSAEGGVIQDLSLNIGVTENPGDARKGVVLALPASVAETITDPEMQLVDQDVREEYKQYIVTTVNQSAAPGSIEAVNPTGMAEIGTGFEKLSSDDWYLTNFQVNDGYKLIYTKAWSNDPEATLKVTDENKPITGYTFYDYDLNRMTGDASWLSVRTVTGGFIVDMDPSKDKCGGSSMMNEGIAHMGFVVLSNADGDFTVIQCIYDENYPLGGDDGEFTVEFAYPTEVTGATLVHITQENQAEMSERYPDLSGDFAEQLGMGTPIYMLSYTSATPYTTTLKTSASFENAMVMPFSGAEWLEYEPQGADMINIYMNKPGDDQIKIGAMVQLLDAGWNFKAIIYCDPAF